jgi:hypothetical protein
MECIEYDHHFQQDMAAKLKLWDTSEAHAQRVKMKEVRRALKHNEEDNRKERGTKEKRAGDSAKKRTKAQGGQGKSDSHADSGLHSSLAEQTGPPHHNMRRLWKATTEAHAPCPVEPDKESSSDLTEYDYGDSDGI